MSHIMYTGTVCSLHCGNSNAYVLRVLDFGFGGWGYKEKMMQCAIVLKKVF